MNADPILCRGPELLGVLADIRSRGGVVESLDTGVNGNAGYRVNYFYGGKTAWPVRTLDASGQALRNGQRATNEVADNPPSTPRSLGATL